MKEERKGISGSVPQSISPSHDISLTDPIVKLTSLPYKKFKISQILQSNTLPQNYNFHTYQILGVHIEFDAAW